MSNNSLIAAESLEVGENSSDDDIVYKGTFNQPAAEPAAKEQAAARPRVHAVEISDTDDSDGPDGPEVQTTAQTTLEGRAATYAALRSRLAAASSQAQGNEPEPEPEPEQGQEELLDITPTPEAPTLALANYASTPDRAPQPSQGIDAALGDAFNTGGRSNSRSSSSQAGESVARNDDVTTVAAAAEAPLGSAGDEGDGDGGLDVQYASVRKAIEDEEMRRKKQLKDNQKFFHSLHLRSRVGNLSVPVPSLPPGLTAAAQAALIWDSMMAGASSNTGDFDIEETTDRARGDVRMHRFRSPTYVSNVPQSVAAEVPSKSPRFNAHSNLGFGCERGRCLRS